MVLAITPLPVPCSPVMRTLASEADTRETRSITGCIAADSAISGGRPCACSSAVFRFEALAATQRARQLDLRADAGDQPGVVPGLLEEIAGAAAHRLDGQIDRAPGGHARRRAGVESSAWTRESRSRPSSPEVVSRV